MPSPNHPPDSFVAEPLLLWLKNSILDPNGMMFAGQTTTTPEGNSEYTVSLPYLAPEDRMTHWLTVDTDHVVSLEKYR